MNSRGLHVHLLGLFAHFWRGGGIRLSQKKNKKNLSCLYRLTSYGGDENWQPHHLNLNNNLTGHLLIGLIYCSMSFATWRFSSECERVYPPLLSYRRHSSVYTWCSARMPLAWSVWQQPIVISGGGSRYYRDRFFSVPLSYFSLQEVRAKSKRSHHLTFSFFFFFKKKVYAFYGRKRKLLAVLLLLLTAEFSTMISMVVTSLPKEVAKPNPIPHIHAAPCIGISQPKIMSSLWYVKTLEY